MDLPDQTSGQLVWITIAELCLFAIWQGRASWPVVLTMAVAIGLAGLTKGPVVLGFLGTIIFAVVLRKQSSKMPKDGYAPEGAPPS